jgi:hypothetical protein
VLISLLGPGNLDCGCHFINFKFVCLEQFIEFFSQIQGVARTFWKASSAIFGALIVYETVNSLEVYGLAVVTYAIDSTNCQYLLTYIVLGVGVTE